MSDLIQELLQQRHAGKVDGSHLEMLGKQAAEMWGEGRVKNLSDAVVQTVKSAGLSPEQVRRVIEFTNVEAYNKEFKKEGSPNRVVNFAGGPADPVVIFKDLNDGGGGNVFDAGTGDYSSPPEEKRAFSLAEENEFDQMFTSSGLEYPEVNPYGDVIELRDKLASEHGRLTSEIGQNEVDFQVLSGSLFGHVKQAALNGHSLSEIVHIWNGIAPDQIFVKVAMEGMLPQLVENGVFTSDSLVESLQKVAEHRVPNPAHPLVSDFAAYCDVLSKLASMREMQEEAANAIGDLNAFIKAAFEGVAPAVGRAAEKVWNVAGKGGEMAGKLIHNSEAGAKWGRRAGKAALVAGAGLGANEAYRRTLKYDPTFQRGVQTLKEITPGTQEYYNKDYQLASGGF